MASKRVAPAKQAVSREVSGDHHPFGSMIDRSVLQTLNGTLLFLRTARSSLCYASLAAHSAKVKPH